MIVWVDAQLSPALAPWLTSEFGIDAFSVRHLNLVRAKDASIFEAARSANVVVLTKDSDFVALQERRGSPPAILWVRCGNTSNAYLKRVLQRTFPAARKDDRSWRDSRRNYGFAVAVTRELTLAHIHVVQPGYLIAVIDDRGHGWASARIDIFKRAT